MTISMSEQASVDLNQELDAQVQYPDPKDKLDLLFHLPLWLSEGYTREITLREGLEISIDNYRLCDSTECALPEREHWLSFHFHLSGEHQDTCTEVSNLEYALYGSGLAPKGIIIGSDRYPILEVTVSMSPQVLISFIGHDGEPSSEFQHLIRQSNQKYYTRVGTTSPAMQRVLSQIIRCPYTNIPKRMYLEAKALEVAALVLEHETEVQQGKRYDLGVATRTLDDLKPDYVARIYRAREILLKNLHQPLSLVELARQVELNDYLLKRGFKQVFGKTVFSYLHDYRMEQAQQLFMSGNMKVIEVMRTVGISDAYGGLRLRKYFATAFRKKFGVNPRDYLKVQLKKSV